MGFSLENSQFYLFPDAMLSYECKPAKAAIGFNQDIYFLDVINKSAAIYNGDELKKIIDIELDDPIDILQSGLSVFILDQINRQVVEYDLSLNFVNSFSFPDIYPEFFATDNNGNIYILSSYDQGIWKNPWRGNEFPLIDLTNSEELIDNFVDFAVNPVEEIALLDERSNTHLYNQIGTYYSVLKWDIINPACVFWWHGSWCSAKYVKDIPFLNGKDIIGKKMLEIIDVSTNNNYGVVLTKLGWLFIKSPE